MRNFSNAVVTSTEVFKGQYETALATARSKQTAANKASISENWEKDNYSKSYTIEGDENTETKVIEHIGQFGGQPPYQPIVHGK